MIIHCLHINKIVILNYVVNFAFTFKALNKFKNGTTFKFALGTNQ